MADAVPLTPRRAPPKTLDPGDANLLDRASMKIALVLAAVTLVAGCATPRATPVGPPRVDDHQHLVSGPFSPVVRLPERDGAALLREMDEAGIRRAVVLSVGYSFADEG